MRVRPAQLPPRPAELLFDDGSFALASNAFQFVTDGGVGFHYVRGEGLAAQLPGPEAEDEFRLYLWGTVFGAVSWLNGFFPLHASAVDIGGEAVAFTGDSGAGKSTLAAGLALAGFPHVSDDTLALARADGAILAVPDRKPLKLWSDALGLLRIEGGRAIRAVPGKSFARPPVSAKRAMPLRHLVVIEEDPSISIAPVAGREAIRSFADAVYRSFIPAHLGDAKGHSRWLLALAGNVRVWRLGRPKVDGRRAFGDQLGELERLIRALPV